MSLRFHPQAGPRRPQRRYTAVLTGVQAPAPDCVQSRPPVDGQALNNSVWRLRPRSDCNRVVFLELRTKNGIRATTQSQHPRRA